MTFQSNAKKNSDKKIMAKILLLGDGAVGKTALIQRYIKQSFGGMYKATMGLDLSLKEVAFPEAVVGIQLWDLGGQTAFKSLRSRLYTGTQGIILVYDVTRPQTFNNLDDWMAEVNENIPTEVPIVVLGNKSDLIDMTVVSINNGETKTNKLGALEHFRTSAKTGENVETAFFSLATKVYDDAIRLEEEKEEKGDQQIPSLPKPKS